MSNYILKYKGSEIEKALDSIPNLYDKLEKIRVPEKTSDLFNDSNFISDSEYNRFSIEDKNKLASLRNYDDTEIRQILSKKLESIPNNYITEEKLEGKNYATKSDIVYYNDSELRSLISEKLSKVPEEYVTESELESKGYLTSHQDISHLATKVEVSEKANKADLVDFVTESFVTQEISKIPQYNDTEIREILKKKIEEIPEEYVTESELESKGYLTQHQDISHLATKIEISEKANKADLVDFVTESELESKGYLTEHQDISALASKDYVDQSVSSLINGAPETLNTLKEVSDALKANEDVVIALNESIGSKADKSSLVGLATESFVISEITKIPSYDDTEIRDLVSSKLSEIPEEYITESELESKGYLTEHQDISKLATKAELKEISDSMPKEYNDSELRELINTKISEIPEEYVTEIELNSKGYLTEHQDISNLALKSDFENLLKKIKLLEEKLLLQQINLSSEGSTVLLDEDIELIEKPLILDKKIILDLQGKTITGGIFTESNSSVVSGNSDSYAIWAKNGADITISGNGSIVSQEATYSMAVWANGGDVKIESGKFSNAGDGCDLIYASAGGKVYIYGGEFKATKKIGIESGTSNMYSVLNVKDSDYKSGASNIIVYGGRYFNFNPANNVSEGPNTNFLATGYTVLVNGSENLNAWNSEMGDTWFEVVKKEEKLVSTESELVKEITSGNNIKLSSSISIESPLEIKSEQIINLNNQSITSGVFEIDGSTDSYPIWATEGAKIVLEGDGQVISQEATYSMAVWANGGTVIINSGIYRNAGDGCDLIYASAGGKVYIYGGEFYATENPGDVPATKNKYSALNVKDIDYKSGASEIIVYGGRFYNFNPANNLSEGPGTNFVAPGYKSVEIENGVFEVIKE